MANVSSKAFQMYIRLLFIYVWMSLGEGVPRNSKGEHTHTHLEHSPKKAPGPDYIQDGCQKNVCVYIYIAEGFCSKFPILERLNALRKHVRLGGRWLHRWRKWWLRRHGSEVGQTAQVAAEPECSMSKKHP